MKEKVKLFTALTYENNENKNEEKLFTAPKWTEYQDVKPLNIHIPPTEEDEKKVEEFRKFIDDKIKNEKKTKNNL